MTNIAPAALIEEYIHSSESDRKTHASIKSALMKFFGDTDIPCLTADKFLTLLHTRGTKNLKAVIHFLWFLDDLSIVTDQPLRRIALNADIFGSHTPTDMVDAIVKSPDYDRATDQKLLLSHEGRMVFLTSFKGTASISLRQDIRDACDEIIRETAFDESLTVNRRLESIREILGIAESILTNLTVQPDRYSIGALFSDTVKKPKRVKRTGKQLGTVVKILSKMDEKDLIQDQGLQYFLRVLYPNLSAPAKSGTATSRPLADYLTVLTQGDIRRWEVLYPSKYNNQLLVYIDIAPSELRDALIDYMNEYCTSITSKWKKVCEDFSISLDGNVPVTPTDLNFKTWRKQIEYFIKDEKDNEEKLSSGVLSGFYLYVWKHYNPRLFTEAAVSPRVLKLADLGPIIRNGYEIIPYSGTDNVPYEDKWLLWFGGSEKTNTDKLENGARKFDFSGIKNPLYRYWSKAYFWYRSSGITTKTAKLPFIADFLNFLHDLKTGNEMAVFADNSVHFFKTDVMDDINGAELSVYKDHAFNESVSLNSAIDRIYAVRNFLNFVRQEKLGSVAPEYEKILTGKKEQNNIAHALKDDELKLMNSELERIKDESFDNLLSYYAFKLLMWTDLRITEILGLETDCVVASAIPSKSYLQIQRKIGGESKERRPELPRVIKLIERVLDLTKDLRETTSDDDMRKYLFIVPDKRFADHITRLKNSQVNDLLKRACRNMQFENKYTSKNCRYTWMNKVDDYAVEKDMNDLERKKFSGHTTSRTDEKFYIDKIKARRAMESLYRIVIGDIDHEIFPLNGNVTMAVKKDISKPENEVRGGTGWCGDGKCTAAGLIDCLICPKFVTDVSKHFEFLMAIDDADNAILKAANQHEKEDLVMVKTILVMYLEKILLLKRQRGDYEKEKVND